jgi:ribonuclease G
MTKELFISSSPHETKVAVLEDDQLVEVYYQRDTDVGLVGSIYKGRVTRVLPGMQSAFVNIGLERDAFLYVSDVFEDSEEYDRVMGEAETRVSRYAVEEQPAQAAAAPASRTGSPAEQASLAAATGDQPGTEEPAGASPAQPVEAAAFPETGSATPAPAPGDALSHTNAMAAPQPVRNGEEGHPHRRHGHRGRRRRRRGRAFDKGGLRAERPASGAASPGGPATFEVLPGESLAKYAHVSGAESVAEASGVEVGETPASSSAQEPVSGSAEAAPPVHEPAPDAHLPQPSQEALSRKLAEEAAPEPSLTAEVPLPVPESSQVEQALEDSIETGPVVTGPGDAAEIAADHLTPDAPLSTTEGSSQQEQGSPPSPDANESAPSGEEPSAPHAALPAEEHTTAAAESGDERSYTLRESGRRPRFAPRRSRRHRFGYRGARLEPAQAARGEPRGGNFQPVQINELLKEGQEILVQIAKEPLGTKGARITSHIALPGRYLVYMPTIDHIGVSRKIASEEERLRLRNIILEHRGSLTGGFIVRTAGAGRSEEELKADIEFLSRLWADIRARAERVKAPALIHRDLTLVQRILRDLLSPDFKTIRVDNETEYEHVVEFVSRCQPSLIGHVKLYTRETPMFEEFGIQAEIDKALKPKVWLKSGGYIVINQTEALVAIDVNTGKYVGRTNRLEDTIVKTNIDAVNEIVRQIRLRDLGGIIVIDFIDMDDRRNRHKVVQALEEALRADRAPTKILSFNEFGLVALTRKRVKQSLERTLCEPCPYCSGAGWVKSVTTVCLEVVAEARKMASQIEGDVLTLRLSPAVARALKSSQSVLISELESAIKKEVVIKSDPAVHQEQFEIF